MHNHKILNIASPDAHLQNTLSKELGISKILAQVLINRGIKTAGEAEKFLDAKLDHLCDPYSFSQMRQAVAFIKRAVKNKEKVMLFGDYDVDGITSIALLKATLSKLGLEAMHYLPHRIKEGYGLNKNVLRFARENNIKLLITADCGTNDDDKIKELRRDNIDVIITDHHEPANHRLSSASSILNPKLKDSNYAYRDLAGVGVVYKLCQALKESLLAEDLDLVALGTIADSAPLTGENRIIAREGLLRLAETQRVGLRLLIENAGIQNKKFNSTLVNFILGPRLNASGRMDSAEASLNLLLSQDYEQASKLAQALEQYNRRRQKIESRVMEEAQDLINKEINFREHKVIVLAKEDWHRGVLGIVASKLADRFYRPAIVISLSNGLCQGSARSIKNFHLFEALSECRHLLETFGGHAHAAGLVISKENIAGFKESINRIAHQKLLLEDLLPRINVDMELGFSDLNEKIIGELESLEPHGEGNPEALFYTKGLKLKSQPQTLSRQTLKFWVTDGNITFEAIGFGMSNFKESLLSSESFDLVYSLRMDNWEGEASVLLEVKEMFFH